MDSDELIEVLEPYIHDICAYILLYMGRELDLCGKRDLFLTVLQRELEAFFVRTGFPERVEQALSEEKSLYWAIGRDYEFAAWSWIDGEATQTLREEGPIRLALKAIGEPFLAHRFPQNVWFEIWYGQGSIKFLLRERRKVVLYAPSWLESAILLLERKLNEYYLEQEAVQERRLVSGNDEMYVLIKQTRSQEATYYSCTIEKPRGTNHFYLPRQRSVTDLVLTLCHDVPEFEVFMRHHRFVEARSHALYGERSDGFISLSELWQEALQRVARKKEHPENR